jgi:flavorubredoxin
MIQRKIDEVVKMNLPISMIAPSHGLIWRQDPLKIVNQYVSWAGQKPLAKVVIVFETMWGSTARMAVQIAEGLRDAGVSVKIYDVAQSDKTEIITDMLDAKGFLFGSSTHDNDMLPTLAGFMELVKGFKPKNRVAGVFGSYGWGGGAVKELEEVIKAAGVDLGIDSLQVKFMPDENENKACVEFGKNFATKIIG